MVSPNIVVVLLRRIAVGRITCYGPRRADTPRLDNRSITQLTTDVTNNAKPERSVYPLAVSISVARRSRLSGSKSAGFLPTAPYLDRFSESERALHARVLALRDTTTAHGDHELRNVEVELLRDPQDGRSKVRSYIDHDCLVIAELILLHDMLFKILEAVESDISAMQPHVLPELTLESGKLPLNRI